MEQVLLCDTEARIFFRKSKSRLENETKDEFMPRTRSRSRGGSRSGSRTRKSTAQSCELTAGETKETEHQVSVCVKERLKPYSSPKGLSELGAGQFGCTFKLDCTQHPYAIKVEKTQLDHSHETRQEAFLAWYLTAKHHILGVTKTFFYTTVNRLPSSLSRQMDEKCVALAEDWQKKRGILGITASEFLSGGSVLKLPKAQLDAFVFSLLVSSIQIHQLGVKHNDLKPENLLMTNAVAACISIVSYKRQRWQLPTGKATAKIIDWGLATYPAISLSRKTWSWATPAYLPPEFFLESHVRFDADEQDYFWSKAAPKHRDYSADTYAVGLTCICTCIGEELAETEDSLLVKLLLELQKQAGQEDDPFLDWDRGAVMVLAVQYLLQRDAELPRYVDEMLDTVFFQSKPFDLTRTKVIRSIQKVFKSIREKLDAATSAPLFECLQALCAWKPNDRNELGILRSSALFNQFVTARDETAIALAPPPASAGQLKKLAQEQETAEKEFVQEMAELAF